MKLGVKDRLLLSGLLPGKGDITTLRIVQDLRGALSFSEKEHAALNFVQDGERLDWNTDGDVPCEIPIGPKAKELVAGILKELSEAGDLAGNMLSIYDLFVEEDAGDATA